MRSTARSCAAAVLGLAISLAGCRGGRELPEAGSWQLHPDLEISLFAAEPDVVDPVALTFDAAGRMYVVEMRDYPLGVGADRRPGGSVRLLEDRDGDGRADRATVFAEGLSFPTSIAPWRGGVVVTAPPEILYLEDRDGDGRADRRVVLFEGFELGVTDSNVNGLRWGLDNRLHGLNGGNGGTVSAPGSGQPPLELRGRDFRFDPTTRRIEPTFQTSAGFGLVFDAYGRSFSTYNIDHLQQRIVPVRYLEREPALRPVDATQNISEHGGMARIYPIAAPQTRPNHPEQSGFYSAAGGMGYLDFEGDGLPKGVLVCDVVGHVVSREVLEPDGAIFRSHRPPEEATREFFASRDPAFRPIGVEMGPDGALYLVDMQRGTIEHPDYIPAAVRATLDLRDGADRGRIYRIVPRAGLPPSRPPLASASPAELVAELGSASRWRRITAQRLLVERGEAPVDLLREVARSSPDPLQRLHALWTLEGVSALDLATLERALEDVAAGVRENAVVLAERRLAGAPDLGRMLEGMADDDDARVRFQVGLSLGEAPPSPERDTALRKILLRGRDDRWTRLAVATSLGPGAPDALVDLLGRSAGEPGWEPAVEELADLVGAGVSHGLRPEIMPTLIGAIVAAPKAGIRVAALRGLDSGLARNDWRPEQPSLLALRLVRREATELTEESLAALRLRRRLGASSGRDEEALLELAAARAADGGVAVEERRRAIGFLALGTFGSSSETLLELLEGTTPSPVQLAAVEALSGWDEPSLGGDLMARWRRLTPAARPAVLRLLLRRPGLRDALLSAIESGRVTAGELDLDLEQRRLLLRWSEPSIRERAARFFGDADYSGRSELVDEWLAKLPPSGNAERGRDLYEELCARCHRAGEAGHAVGPGFESLRHRGAEDLLTNILDPDVAINPEYVSYNALLDSGELVSGLLEAETSEAVTLLQAGEERRVLPRSAIVQLESSGASLMPKGLEEGRTPQDLRDLIAFIQGP